MTAPRRKHVRTQSALPSPAAIQSVVYWMWLGRFRCRDPAPSMTSRTMGFASVRSGCARAPWSASVPERGPAVVDARPVEIGHGRHLVDVGARGDERLERGHVAVAARDLETGVVHPNMWFTSAPYRTRSGTTGAERGYCAAMKRMVGR